MAVVKREFHSMLSVLRFLSENEGEIIADQHVVFSFCFRLLQGGWTVARLVSDTQEERVQLTPNSGCLAFRQFSWYSRPSASANSRSSREELMKSRFARVQVWC